MPNVTIADNGPETAAPSNHDVALNQARLLNNNWRTARSNQNKLGQKLVLACVLDNYAFGAMKDNIRKAMPKLAKEDANSLKVMFSTCGVIIDRWHAIPQAMKDAFISGATLYSTLARDVKAAEKAQEKADAEAAEAERLAELGIDAETDKANAKRASEADANIAACERAIAMLALETRTPEEVSAMGRLMMAIAVYQQSTIDAAKAA